MTKHPKELLGRLETRIYNFTVYNSPRFLQIPEHRHGHSVKDALTLPVVTNLLYRKSSREKQESKELSDNKDPPLSTVPTNSHRLLFLASKQASQPKLQRFRGEGPLRFIVPSPNAVQEGPKYQHHR